jgi:cytochrome c peroxidase
MTDHALFGGRGRTALRRSPCRVLALLGFLWMLGLGCAYMPIAHAASVMPEPQEPLLPLPLALTLDPTRVTLGARLFQDVRLSGRNTVACATCHLLERGGADGRPTAMNLGGSTRSRNTPTVFNVAFNFAYHWDGALPTLEAQAEHVLLSPALMHTTWPELLGKLREDPDYMASFQASYPDGLTPANILDALATYQRSLITPNARLDQHLRGQPQALTDEELRGYQLFKAYGCVACHQGVNVGGNLYQKFGIFSDQADSIGSSGNPDPGRVRITGLERDRGVFRVPSLRNVAQTAPYFHDGRAATLEEAVDTMARVQLGRTLTREEVGLIVQFLHTLTGEYQGRPLAHFEGEDR